MKLQVHQHPRPVARPVSEGENLVYQDANIKVRAFQHLPDVIHQTRRSSSKRRSVSRSRSPPAKPGRPNFDGIQSLSETANMETPHSKDCSEPSSATLNWSAPDFDTKLLHGEQAETWRRMIIQDMFRGGGSASNHRTYVSNVKDKRPPTRVVSPAYDYSYLPKIEVPPCAVSYLVTGPAIRGRFKPNQAKAMGISPGPDFARLHRGEAVTLPDGSVVRSEDCCDPGQPASVS